MSAGDQDYRTGMCLGTGGTFVAAEEYFSGPDRVHVTLVKLHETGVEQVRQIVREEIARALKETFQR